MMGRRLKMLDPDVRERLVVGIEQGLTIESAAVLAGISRRTYYNWWDRALAAEAKAEAGEVLSETEMAFRQFLHTLTRAHARAQVRLCQILWKIAEGGYVTKTKTKVPKVDPVTGNRYLEVTEIWYARPDLRAVQFMLERRWPEAWGTPAQQAAAQRRRRPAANAPSTPWHAATSTRPSPALPAPQVAD